ncbi:MAG: Two-component system response regulator [Magnetococcales bacterium]|nr:Two-component system response regulator [Magnetococcales bacterium]HIJ82795.1 response regulator [Magnetococcales bacterium]
MFGQEKGPLKTVLIVDDVSENIDILNGILDTHYRVQVATNGRLAIKVALLPTPPDLILLDVMMPEMDGYAVCRLLKEDDRTRDIPVLFVSSKTEMEDELKGFALGAADYLFKPVCPSIVLARVKTHLALNDQTRHFADQVKVRTHQLMLQKLELEETRQEVIRQLGRAAEYRDNETGMHVMRMSHYVRLLALQSGLSEPEGEKLMLATPMHDLGKIGIPDSILLKPGKLTEAEFAVIQTHCAMGFNIIGKQKSDILNLGALIALTHHEKWDGSGYPGKLVGEAIPLEGRLVAIGDVFDALTTARPYKKPWLVDTALSLIAKEADVHFDPRLAAIFVGLKTQIVAIMERYQENPNNDTSRKIA